MKNYKCTHCNNISSSDEWDKATMDNNCYNRKQRRSYKSILYGKNYNWYECPHCRYREYKNKILEVR